MLRIRICNLECGAVARGRVHLPSFARGDWSEKVEMRLRAGGSRSLRAPAGPTGPGRAALITRRRLCLPLVLAMCMAITWIGSLHIQRARQPWELSSVAGDGLYPTPWHPSSSPRTGVMHWMKRRHQLMMCTGLCTDGDGQDHKVRLNVDDPKAVPKAESGEGTTACPSFFQWIYDDLAPWKETGISEEHVMAAKQFAAFRVVILNGELFVDTYYRCVQSRGLFTLWSLVQLLQRFPGLVPDVDLMFDCMDRPHFEKARDANPLRDIFPPLFRYCTTAEHLDIPFPDWSFWGWPEVRLKPWQIESSRIFRGSDGVKWEDRDKFAYWKGNPNVGSPDREELMRCNASPDNPTSNAHIYKQDWVAEVAGGFHNSSIAEQCRHRFMVYAEGHAWSVSYKYIMSCGSPVLAIASAYYEFFTRGLLPMEHYVPARKEEICVSIKALVDAGNAKPVEMKAIGSAGQRFLRNDLSMENVYNYMFHLLKEYSKLMRYKPRVPPRAERVCRSKIICLASEDQLPFLLQSDDMDSEVPRSAPDAQGNTLRPCALPVFNPTYFLDREISRQAGLLVADKMEKGARKKWEVG